MANLTNLNRCNWCLTNDLYISYHDEEWGVPCFDDQVLFEQLVLESFQSGLSWLTVLKKRPAFRNTFSNFDIEAIAHFDASKVESLLQDASIIRHRGKIEATINNANAVMSLYKKKIKLSDFFWKYVNHKPVVHDLKTLENLNASNELSKRIAKDLKQLNFKFLGPTTIYSFLQASGIINDHLNDCFRKHEV